MTVASYQAVSFQVVLGLLGHPVVKLCAARNISGDRLTVRIHQPGGCGVSTFARKLPAMRVEQLKSREISPVGCKPWLGVFLLHT